MMMSTEHRELVRTYGTVVGRVLMGLLFVGGGLSMLFMQGPENVGAYFASVGVPLGALMAWPVIILKVVAGGMLMAGYRVGVAATALILFTLGATLIAHMDPNDTGLFKNLAIVGGLLYVIAYGKGGR